MNGEFPYTYNHSPELEALKEAAFSVLHDHEGCDRQDWIEWIIADHSEELTDAIGNDPYDVYPQLEDYWDSMDYEDPVTGLSFTYRDWAEYFANWEHRKVYDRLNEVCEQLYEANRKLATIKESLE